MKSLVINADDFGLREQVNRTIIDGCAAGLLSATSVLANMPASAQALALARDHRDLDVGIHLNLSCGEPAAPVSRVRSLVREDGRFQPMMCAWLWKMLRSRVRTEEVRIEFEAQIGRVVDAGVRPTHLDGHHHVHLFPGILPLAIDLARRFGIPAVRVPREIRLARSGVDWRGRWKQGLLASWVRRGESSVSGIDRPDAFVELPVGLTKSRAYLGILLRVVGTFPDGRTELACHPGYSGPDPEATVPSGPDPELEALADPAWHRELEAHGVRILRGERDHG